MSNFPRVVIAGFTGALAIAAALVIPFEGWRQVAYYDPPGIPTICAGHTGGVEIGDVATDAECAVYLKEDLTAALGAVDRMAKVPLSEETRAALASFTFNVGAGNLARSTLLRKLNAGDIIGACNQLSKWVYSGGVKLAGLVRRREAERQLCLRGAG